jgi:hypothetical protein
MCLVMIKTGIRRVLCKRIALMLNKPVHLMDALNSSFAIWCFVNISISTFPKFQYMYFGPIFGLNCQHYLSLAIMFLKGIK